MKYGILLLCLFMTGVLSADTSSKLNIKTTDGSVSTYPYQLKVSPGSLTDNGDGTATLSSGGGTTTLPLPGGDTSYIQNNPATVQVATMSITGSAGFDTAGMTVYTSSPTAASDGSLILAKDSGSSYPCIFMFVGGVRYHMCGCPDSSIALNTGQCMGLLCGVTYP